MPKYVRVREGDWEYTIPDHRLGEGLKKLDKDAVAPSGKPLPPKPVMPMGTPAPGSQQERVRAAKTSEATRPEDTPAGRSAAPEEEK